MTDDHHDFYVITRNAAKCNQCGDEIESTHRHDFRRCSCDAISVDGGNAYLKRSARDFADITELSTYRKLTKDELLAKIAYYHECSDSYGKLSSSDHWHQMATTGERFLQEWYSNMGVTDMLNQPISIGDYVVFTNNLYVVRGLPTKVYKDGFGTVQIMLASPSKTTTPVKKTSKDMVVVNKQHVEALLSK